MFKDTPEGTTHYFGDGCKPAHTPDPIAREMEKILESEPMEWLFSIERTAQITGRAPQYSGKLIQDVIKSALTRIYQAGIEEGHNQTKK